MAKRGRKPYTSEQREAAAELRSMAGPKTKNITLDGDLVEALNTQADALVGKLGFRPTLSQTVRYLIKRGDE